MGHRSCTIVRHRPTTLPGAPSRTRDAAGRRQPGRADKTKKKKKKERRKDRGPSIGHFRPIFTPSGFGESLTTGPIDRSAATAFNVFDAESINEVWQARAVGIPDEHRTCESISEFEACSRVLEEPSGGPSTGEPVAERSSGSINTLIPSSIVGSHPVRRSPYTILFVKSRIRKDNGGINRRLAGIELEKRFPIIARPSLLPSILGRLSNERAATRVDHVSIFASEVSRKQFSSSSSSSRGFSLILVAISFRAAAMTFGRGTSFR